MRYYPKTRIAEGKLFEELVKGCYQMTDVLAVRDEYRAQQWAMLIQESKSSGMSNKEFCIQRGVSEKSFYYWQKKLRAKLAEAAAPQLVQLDPVSVPTELLQISFRGAELKLPVGVDMDAVSAILRSIQSL